MTADFENISFKNLTIRKALNSDAQEITSLIFGVLKEYGLKTDPEKTDSDLLNIEENYFLRGGFFNVVCENGKIVGTVGVYSLGGNECELRKMYLPKEQRGKGLGKFLLELSLKRARELGFSKVVLETASVLKEAINLYERYGFQRYYPDHISNRCDQAYFLNI